MTEDIYSRILKFIRNSLENKQYSNVSISLFGGEPFVEYEKVVNFLRSVKEICIEYNAGYSSNATTNGALIYPERFEVLTELNCNYYQITIDGFAKTHDKYRVSADNNGSWDKIMNNLKYMSSTAHNFKVTIRTNFNNEVFEKAEEFYKYIKDNFDDRFSVYYEGIKRLGGSNDDNIEILDSNDVSKSSVGISKVPKLIIDELLTGNNFNLIIYYVIIYYVIIYIAIQLASSFAIYIRSILYCSWFSLLYMLPRCLCS